jgi:hypothetical protein
VASRLPPRELALAALLAVPLALLFTWTQVFPLDGIPVMGTDYGQLVWNMWSVDRAIATGESPLHSDMVFHPIGTSLAAHVLTPGFFPITAAVKAARGSEDLLYPLIAFKFAIGLCYVAIAFSMWVFLRRIGAGVVSALAVTIAYAFSPFAQLHAPHLNHLTVAAMLPLVGWSLVSLWERPRLGPVRGRAVIFGGGPYFGELIAFAWVTFLAIGAVLLASAARREAVVARLRAIGHAADRSRAGCRRDPRVAVRSRLGERGGAQPMNARQAGFWSANLAAFVIPDPGANPWLSFMAPLHRRISKGVAGHEAFLGYVLIAAALAGLWRCARLLDPPVRRLRARVPDPEPRAVAEVLRLGPRRAPAVLVPDVGAAVLDGPHAGAMRAVRALLV